MKPQTEKIEVKNIPLSEQTITKQIGAIEVNKELKTDKIYFIGVMVGLLATFGLTNINSLLGGVVAILCVGVMSIRLAMIVKKMNYFKATYNVE